MHASWGGGVGKKSTASKCENFRSLQTDSLCDIPTTGFKLEVLNGLTSREEGQLVVQLCYNDNIEWPFF